MNVPDYRLKSEELILLCESEADYNAVWTCDKLIWDEVIRFTRQTPWTQVLAPFIWDCLIGRRDQSPIISFVIFYRRIYCQVNPFRGILYRLTACRIIQAASLCLVATNADFWKNTKLAIIATYISYLALPFHCQRSRKPKRKACGQILGGKTFLDPDDSTKI